ncbi:MAG: hypothetical protein JSS62_04040 [Verrucomicrobia bacterium]|nr:hypothetical protein [Verrucomicrobiota bacterium]MBS0647216.1 hypothetical protein [Verrucomicrobiota bacterium]
MANAPSIIEHRGCCSSPAQKHLAAWMMVALSVATIVCIGGLGLAGLLQSHGVVSLAHLPALNAAVGTIGHQAAFWTMAVGGGALGSVSLIWGTLQIYRANKHSDEKNFAASALPLPNSDKMQEEDSSDLLADAAPTASASEDASKAGHEKQRTKESVSSAADNLDSADLGDVDNAFVAQQLHDPDPALTAGHSEAAPPVTPDKAQSSEHLSMALSPQSSQILAIGRPKNLNGFRDRFGEVDNRVLLKPKF